MSGLFGTQLKDVFQLMRTSLWTPLTDGPLWEFSLCLFVGVNLICSSVGSLQENEGERLQTGV